jgi:hypothetical protein
VPRPFWLWLAAVQLTSLGTQVLAFGMAWTATATSATLAGLVLTATVLPRVVLAAVGGTVADRLGPAQAMTASGVGVLVIATFTAVAVLLIGSPPWLLVGVAVGLGTLSTFYIPASGAMPRLLVPEASLPKAMAAEQVLRQCSAFTAPPLGGVVVATMGIAGAAAAEAVGAACMLALMLVVRKSAADPDPIAPEPFMAQVVDGFRVTVGTPLLRGLLVVLVVVAGFLIPVTSLLVPILARENGWGAGAAGMVVASYAVGAGSIGLVVMLAGGARRPGLASAAGLILAATGTMGLALSTSMLLAMASALLAGAGTGTFTTHAAPLLLAGAPRSHLARVQAMLLLTQSAPLLVSTSALGLLADATSAFVAGLCCAGGTLAASAVALCVRDIREARKPGDIEVSGSRTAAEPDQAQAVPLSH